VTHTNGHPDILSLYLFITFLVNSLTKSFSAPWFSQRITQPSSIHTSDFLTKRWDTATCSFVFNVDFVVTILILPSLSNMEEGTGLLSYTQYRASSRQKSMLRRYCRRSSLLMSEMLHGGLITGHSCNICSAVWTEPHSHWLDVARPIFTMFALERPTPVRSRFSCTQAFLRYWYPSGFGVSSLMYSFRVEGTCGKAIPSFSRCSTHGRSSRLDFKRVGVGCIYNVWCNRSVVLNLG